MLQMLDNFFDKYLLQMRWRGRDGAVGLLLLVQVDVVIILITWIIIHLNLSYFQK